MPTLVCDNYRVEHMEKHNRHIDELITKYLDKSLTREECAELRRYLAEDKKHLAYFAEIRDLWLYNTALWQPIISTRSALEKLKKRIRKYTSLVKIRRTVYYASQIAAVIAITFIFHTVKESNAYSATTHTDLTSTHKSEVTLPDGTIVWLNNNTKLIYPEAFSSTERSVYLEGEAYFKVTKNKARPFVVKSQGQEIKVLGTSFNVRNRPNEDLAETTLISGAVSLRFNNDSVPVRLNPNEQITYSKSNQSIRKDTVVAHEYIAWATEKMTFDNDRFTDVISYNLPGRNRRYFIPDPRRKERNQRRDIQGNSAYLPFAILHTQRYGLFRFPGKHRLSNFTTQPMKHHEATLTKNKRFNHKEYDHFS